MQRGNLFKTVTYDVIMDRRTYDIAFKLVDQLGPSAAYEALNQVDTFEKESNPDKAYFWRRIESAVNIILNEETTGRLH